MCAVVYRFDICVQFQDSNLITLDVKKQPSTIQAPTCIRGMVLNSKKYGMKVIIK